MAVQRNLCTQTVLFNICKATRDNESRARLLSYGLHCNAISRINLSLPREFFGMSRNALAKETSVKRGLLC